MSKTLNPVRWGKSRVCFALKKQAERLWTLGKSYARKGDEFAADNCFRLAKERAKEADDTAKQDDSI
jgi:hypothetical protein